MKDIDEIRRENLRTIERECGGPAVAASLLDMSPAQFINLRNGAKDSKTGKPRGMRKSTARRIESAAKKPAGWLDIDHSTSIKTGNDSLNDITSRYIALPNSKKEIINYILNNGTSPDPEWVDADARAYMDSLNAKALAWLENKSHIPSKKASA